MSVAQEKSNKQSGVNRPIPMSSPMQTFGCEWFTVGADRRNIVRYLSPFSSTPTFWTWANKPMSNITVDSTLLNKLIAENVVLRRQVANINRKLHNLEERMPEEKVIVLREVSKDEAKQEISKLFSTGKTFYYSDIAEELQLDLKLVVEICQELEKAGEVAVDDNG